MNQSDHYADAIRVINMLLCIACAGGLFWRWIGRWMISWPLARWVVGLFAALELIVAFGTAYRAQVGGPFNPAQYLITIHCIVTLAIIAVWPRLTIKRPTKEL